MPWSAPGRPHLLTDHAESDLALVLQSGYGAGVTIARIISVTDLI